MSQFDLTFHHLGLAVSVVDKASLFVKSLGYKLGIPISDPLQRVDLIMCVHPEMPAIELVFNESNFNESPISSILKGRGESIYHICYECNNIINSMELIKSSGLKVVKVSAAKPAILFGGRLVAFYYVSGFGLIELLQEDEKNAS